MIAYCGLDCEKCDIYRATRSDEAERVRVAEAWSKKFGFRLKPENISCDGCPQGEGRLFSFCSHCKVRGCCRDKGLAHCGLCPDAPCEKLGAVFAFSEHIKKAFEALPRN